MKKYRKHATKRLISFLMSIVLLFGLLPISVLAEGTDNFILVVEAGGELVITPEYVTYTEGQTVGEALVGSGHIFTGIEDGWITEINGVVGNYSRSDEDGGYDLNTPASEVEFYRICEN